MSFTLAHISDTHLGAGTALFRANFDRVAAALHGLRPDVMVHTGDASLDGAADGAQGEADLAFAAAAHAGLPGPVLCVPGNHDVGDHPERAPRQPVDDARLERFRRHLGRDRWVLDRDGWRLLGLNSQMMGAHPEARGAGGMMADALETLGDRRLAVFIHKPFFAADPEEDVFDYWSVPPFARDAGAGRDGAPGAAPGRVRPPASAPGGHARARPLRLGAVRRVHRGACGAGRPAGRAALRFPGARVRGGQGGDRLVEPEGMDHPYIHEVRAEAYPG